MDESLLHFIWRYQPYTLNGLKTLTGENIEIIDPGLYNTDSGPDFTNAKIRIGNTIWAGNVEMHIKSSDWFAHNHHTNPAYNNVILHVVIEHDKEATTSLGETIQTLVVPYPAELEKRYSDLIESTRWIPCADKIRQIDTLHLSATIDRMLAERLEAKTHRAEEMVIKAQSSWEEAFYRDTCRSFGLKSNTLPFQLLAQSLPLKYLAKHKNNLLQVEALLFGQSGLLATAKNDDYVDLLKKEYSFLRSKFNLTPIEPSLWKFMRLRPAGFPTIRIAQLAKLIHASTSLFSQLMEITSMEDIYRLLRVEPSSYWHNHYLLGEKSINRPKPLGKETIRLITINTIVPFMFAYGRNRGKAYMENQAMMLLQQLPVEQNSIIKNFVKIGITCSNAFDSQALLHLKTSYCDARKCIYCPIGIRLLRKQN